MYRALVVEDQDLMRLALIAELKDTFGDCYVAGAQTLELAGQLLRQEEFDLVFVDPGLPGFDPTSTDERMHVVEAIAHASPKARLIVITGSDTPPEAESCRKLGVAAYIGKTGLSRTALRKMLNEIVENGFSLRYSDASAPVPEVHFSGLTPREEQIVSLMLRRPPGAKRRAVFEEMAKELSIDTASAEKYYKQARAKLLKFGQLPKGF
ncbi:MAG: response regulator transcription factor [Hyphomicrobiales bacterium]|nr:MAG: response regulator transcription factor [Hyphomicrobiales bacterium]